LDTDRGDRLADLALGGADRRGWIWICEARPGVGALGAVLAKARPLLGWEERRFMAGSAPSKKPRRLRPSTGDGTGRWCMATVAWSRSIRPPGRGPERAYEERLARSTGSCWPDPAWARPDPPHGVGARAAQASGRPYEDARRGPRRVARARDGPRPARRAGEDARCGPHEGARRSSGAGAEEHQALGLAPTEHRRRAARRRDRHGGGGGPAGPFLLGVAAPCRSPMGAGSYMLPGGGSKTPWWRRWLQGAVRVGNPSRPNII
jgi:hypothetical protein